MLINCQHCKDKGYNESHTIRDNGHFPMITKCINPNCQYHYKYYDEIRRRYSLSETERIIPTKDTPNLMSKSSPPSDESLQFQVPQDIITQGAKAISEYIANHLDNISNTQEPISDLCNSQETLDPTSLMRTGVPNQVSHEQDPSESSEYPNIDPGTIEQYREMLKNNKTNGPIAMAITTPFGPRQVESLDEADRILGIIRKYLDVGDLITHADSYDNVTIFPLGRALNF